VALLSPIVQSACRRLLVSVSIVGIAGNTGLLVSLYQFDGYDSSVDSSSSSSSGASGTPVIFRGILRRLTPAVRTVAGSTGLSFWISCSLNSESRGLPQSHILIGSLLHFAAGLLSLLRMLRRSIFIHSIPMALEALSVLLAVCIVVQRWLH
jgi:hypothetical protein